MSTNEIILSRLRSYRRRLRRLLLGEMALILLMGIGSASVSGALWFSYLNSLEGGLIIMGALLLIGTLCAALRVRHGWQLTSLHSQVSRAEGLRKQLRGRLFLAAEELLQEGALVAISAFQRELRDRAAQRCSEVLAGLSSQEMHSNQNLKRFVKQSTVVLAVVVVAQLLLPVGPFQALAALQPVSKTSPAIELSKIDEKAEVVVGDIHLRYVFPDYTQMTPIEIPTLMVVCVHLWDFGGISARSLEMDSVALHIGGAEPVRQSLLVGETSALSLSSMIPMA